MTTRILFVPVLACLLAGCAAQEPQRPMGQSVRRAVQAQILNPDAGGTEPVAGLDGQAGRQVLQGYRDGFGAEKKEGGAESFAVLLGGEKK
ncbi:MAG: hypothetical protein AB1916_08670 [Thermodesulfobacteriota bacterium]